MYYVIVGVIVAICVFVLIVLEIVLKANKDKYDNVNFNIYKLSTSQHFFIPVFWGILMGHLFLGASDPWVENNTFSVVLVALFSILMIIVGTRITRMTSARWVMAALIIIGALIGHFTWSMNEML